MKYGIFFHLYQFSVCAGLSDVLARRFDSALQDPHKFAHSALSLRRRLARSGATDLRTLRTALNDAPGMRVSGQEGIVDVLFDVCWTRLLEWRKDTGDYLKMRLDRTKAQGGEELKMRLGCWTDEVVFQAGDEA